MTARPNDPVLAEWADHLERLSWAALILDKDYNIVWVSDEMGELAAEDDPAALGVGSHVAAAYFNPTWAARIPPESLMKVFQEMVPFVIGDPIVKQAVIDHSPEEFKEFLRSVEPKPMPYFFTGSLDYKPDELDPYQVNFAAVRIHDDEGRSLGVVITFFMDVRPNLFVLLARGNQAMYERMASLVEPRRRQGAVLFADLEASGPLSRQLPTIQYFKLVRELTMCLDAAVAQNEGIIGKHAGDGGSAFFLTQDLGSPSVAARAAIAAARQMQEMVASLDVPVSPELGSCALNVGLHWGAGLYLGQIVPGGRLDVTALGDEVNECARIQESARGGSLLASKALVEQLSDEDAAVVGLDLEKLVYTTLADVPQASDKARRDAGTLAVTSL